MVRNKAVTLAAMAFTAGLGATTVLSQTPAAPGTKQVSLAALRDTHRPVLIFAPNTTPQFLAQIHALAADVPGLHERDIIVIPVLLHDDDKPWGVTLNAKDLGMLSPEDQESARERFHAAPNAFTVLLIGKDGEEKLRSTSPITMDTLRSTIDAMPMRRDEMHSKSPKE